MKYVYWAVYPLFLINSPGQIIGLGDKFLREVAGEVFTTLQIGSKERNRKVIYLADHLLLFHHHVLLADKGNQYPIGVHKVVIDIAGGHLVRNEIIGGSRDDQGWYIYRSQSFGSV